MTDPATGLSHPAADEALLQQLREALGPGPRTPPPASVAALRGVVAQKWRPTVWTRLIRQLVTWARRLQRTGSAAAVFGGLAVGGTGMALAAGGSMHQPAPYMAHDPGIPAASPATQYPGAHVTVVPRATPRPKPTTLPPRRSRPLVTGVAPVRILAPAPPGRSAPVGGTTARRLWSAPDMYRDRLLAGSASRSAPGPTYPVPPVRTTPTVWSRGTSWSGATSTGSWPNGPGPADTSAGSYGHTSSAPSTSTTGFWDRRSPTGSARDAIYAPTIRDARPRSGTDW